MEAKACFGLSANSSFFFRGGWGGISLILCPRLWSAFFAQSTVYILYRPRHIYFFSTYIYYSLITYMGFSEMTEQPYTTVAPFKWSREIWQFFLCLPDTEGVKQKEEQKQKALCFCNLIVYEELIYFHTRSSAVIGSPFVSLATTMSPSLHIKTANISVLEQLFKSYCEVYQLRRKEMRSILLY